MTPKERKELKATPYQLYIYDFKRVNEWLEKYGKRFFVASEMRIKKVFVSMIQENDCFIDNYWINKGITPKTHFSTWKYKKNKYVPDVPFEDGLTPGGKHYLDLLYRYVLLYMHHYYVPNFIMSNQPVLESFTIVKKSRIKRLFSKKLSQDYYKLKEETPFPHPMRGFEIETETAIFYSNTDKELENEIKNTSGIREFHTTSGHLLREAVYLRGITQDPNRVNKSLRELYEGYIHVFRMKFKATSNFIRFIIRFRIFFKKFKILRIKLYKWITRKKQLHIFNNRLDRKIQLVRKKISYLTQKELKKWAKGYIIFYKGIYDNLHDVGKKVKYPTFGVISESALASSDYTSYGFKQTNRITDCFGRYDTHFMYTVREAKEIIYDMHFTQVPNWEQFKVTNADIQFMNYRVFSALLTIVQKEIKREEEKAKKQRKSELQKRKKMEVPKLENLYKQEILSLIIDFGIDRADKVSTAKLKSIEKIDLIKVLSKEYSDFYKKKKLK